MSKPLYETCDLCSGTGRPSDPAIAAKLPDCVCHGKGFLPIGLTDSQVDAMARRIERLRHEPPPPGPDDRIDFNPAGANRLTPAERFQRDPQFNRLVSVMEAMIESAEFTPTEIREAAMLAAVRWEMRRPPRSIMVPKGGIDL